MVIFYIEILQLIYGGNAQNIYQNIPYIYLHNER